MEEQVVSMGRIHHAAKGTRDYAMPTDFCQLFHDHLDHLYTLSLLLTADHGKAEQSFVAGLEDCLQGNPAFREWAQSWARRTVIKNAIRMISPTRADQNQPGEDCGLVDETLGADSPVAAITKLPPFHRFVYVLSVLERYSDRECSVLLDCAVEDIVLARTQALQRLASIVSFPVWKAVELAAWG
jgi:DNA-directed RNA polymerase specialized sigma24 family protein